MLDDAKNILITGWKIKERLWKKIKILYIKNNYRPQRRAGYCGFG